MAFDPNKFIERNIAKAPVFDPDKYIAMQQVQQPEIAKVPEIPLKERLVEAEKRVGLPELRTSAGVRAALGPKFGEPPKTVRETIGRIAEVTPFATGGIGAKLPAIGRIAAQAGITGGARIAEELAKGKKTPEAIKKGLKTGGITGLLMGAFAIPKGIASKIIKSKATIGFGEAAEEAVTKRFPAITEPPKEKMFEIVTKTGRALKGKEKELGKLVGQAKKQFIASEKLIERKPIRESIFRLLREEQLFPRKGEIQKGLKRRGILSSVLKQARRISPESDPKKILDIVENIDDELANTYTRRMAQKALTKAEQAALRIRGKINEFAINRLKEGLPPAKKTFADFKGILTAEGREIERALKTEKGLQKLLESSIKEGRTQTLNNLKRLDDSLPQKDKFLDKTIQKLIEWNLRGTRDIWPSKAGVIEALISGVAAPVAKGLRLLEKPGIPELGGAVRAALLKKSRKYEDIIK